MNAQENIYFTCPCCGYPTLGERGVYEICILCNWEDDGQDNHTADSTLSGPNHGNSLAEARKNWEQYNTMYPPTHKNYLQRPLSPQEMNAKKTFTQAFEHLRWKDQVLLTPQEELLWKELNSKL